MAILTPNKLSLFFYFIYLFRLFIQFIGGALFIWCLLTEGYLMNGSESSVYDYFPIRIVMGTLIGIIYLSAVVFQWLRINLTWFTCSFGIAIGIALHQTNVSFELLLASILLLYAVCVLNLAQSTWFVGHRQFQSNPFNIAIVVGACTKINARKLKPLIYLIGAKLLTIFCYYLPFLYCMLHQSRTMLLADHSYSVSRLTAAFIAVTSFNHLIILLVTRIVLGTFTIFLLHKTAVRDNINDHLTFMYLILFAVVVVIMLITIVDCQWFGICLVALYIAFSFVVDVICQQIISFEDVEFNSATGTISITFATFIEHLIDILVNLLYFKYNDWIGTTYILVAVTMAGFTVIMQQVSRTTIFKCDRIDAQCIL